MNKKSGELTANIIALVAGVVLILLHNRLMLLDYIVMLIGIILILPSVFVIFSYFKTRNDGLPNAGGILAVIISFLAITVGIVMLSKPVIFVGLLTYFLAALLLCFGLYHIIYMASSYRIYKFPLWYYILPVLIFVAGIVILVTDLAKIQSTVVLITGIALVLFAVHSVVTSYPLRKSLKSEEKEEE